MKPSNLEPYFKKDVDLTFARTKLSFAVSQSLFSSHQIDIGTRQLLKALEAINPSQMTKVLDVGCGYGPLGIALAARRPGTHVQLVDRDALAVAFAQHNAVRNGVQQAQAYGSLGYDEVTDRDFDVIVSNIPGKAGRQVIQSLLLDAHSYMIAGGLVAIVVVRPLDEWVMETLSSPGIEITLHKTTSAHAVIQYRFTETDAPEQDQTGWEDGIYTRKELNFLLDELTVPLKTVRGLPEFDTLGHDSILAYKAMQDLEEDSYRRICVFNPRQGLLPVVLWRRFGQDHVDLTGRDLLGLRTSASNLGNNGAPPSGVSIHHQTELLPHDTKPDLVVGILRDDEGPIAIEAELTTAAANLEPGTETLIIGGSTPVTRVLKSKAINRYYRTMKRRRGKGGNSTAVLRRR